MICRFYHYSLNYFLLTSKSPFWGLGGRDRMVVGFTTTCAISAPHHFNTFSVHIFYSIRPKSSKRSDQSQKFPTSRGLVPKWPLNSTNSCIPSLSLFFVNILMQTSLNINIYMNSTQPNCLAIILGFFASYKFPEIC